MFNVGMDGSAGNSGHLTPDESEMNGAVSEILKGPTFPAMLGSFGIEMAGSFGIEKVRARLTKGAVSLKTNGPRVFPSMLGSFGIESLGRLNLVAWLNQTVSPSSFFCRLPTAEDKPPLTMSANPSNFLRVSSAALVIPMNMA